MTDISPEAVEELANKMWGPLGPFQAEIQMKCAATMRAMSAEILRLRASRNEVIEMCLAEIEQAERDYLSVDQAFAAIPGRLRSLKDHDNG